MQKQIVVPFSGQADSVGQPIGTLVTNLLPNIRRRMNEFYYNERPSRKLRQAGQAVRVETA